MATTDPLLTIKANNKLRDIELQADLTTASADFQATWLLKAPELRQLVTPDELKTMVAAIKAGTASNNQLTKFVNVANALLAKI